MQLFDTHAHLLSDAFDEDRDALIEALPEKGVAHVLEACTSYDDVEPLLALLARHAMLFGALGTHPHDAAGMTQAHLDSYAALIPANARIVAIGEIGLDYHYDFSPRDVQRQWFARQLELAQALRMPVVLHSREATGDFMDILRAYKQGLSGVMHCYSGSYETARECLDMGLYIGFGGALTFRNAKRGVDVAEKLPLDCIVIETDCPYMTPEPHRGKRNDPSLVRLVLEKLAEIRGLSLEEAAAVTTENGYRLFGVEH